MRLTRILFVSWDAPDSWYLFGLFAPIFTRLRERGIRVEVMQITWGRRMDGPSTFSGPLPDITIHWVNPPLLRHRSLRFALIGWAIWRLYNLTKKGRYDLIMPRSLIPAFISLISRIFTKCPFLYDCDGFATDEAVEFRGRSNTGLIHRLLRAVEYTALVKATAILVRTSYAKDVAFKRIGGTDDTNHKICKVTNGVSPEAFRPANRHLRSKHISSIGLNPNDRFMVYSGSIGAQYKIDSLFDLFEDCLTKINNLRLVILTKDKASVDEYLVKRSIQIVGKVDVRYSKVGEMGDALAAMDIGVSFREQTMSMKCVAPIKVSEYLMCGLPVITNHAIEDFCSPYVYKLTSFEGGEVSRAGAWAKAIVDDVSEERREQQATLARVSFSLERSVQDYEQAVRRALEGSLTGQYS